MIGQEDTWVWRSWSILLPGEGLVTIQAVVSHFQATIPAFNYTAQQICRVEAKKKVLGEEL